MTFELFIIIPILLMSVVCHEYAHGWAAYRLGDTTAKDLGRLTLNPLKHIDVLGMVVFPMILRFLNLPVLGWAKPVPVNFLNLHNPKRDMIWVSAAGPMTNFVLAVIAAQAFRLIESQSGAAVLLHMIVLNLMLAVFNLIPIPPLDGGRIVVGLLPERLAYRYARIEPFGFIIVLLLLNFGAFDFVGRMGQLIFMFLMGRSF